MKITKKSILALAATLFIASSVFAQEDFGDFGGDDFGGDFGGDSSDVAPALTFNGSAEVIARLFPRRSDSQFDTHDYDSSFTDFASKATWINAAFALNATYSGAYSDLDAKLKFDRPILTGYYEDIVQEFTARAYLGNFQIEAGKMKLVWGKGDKVHVLDNFNSNDYTDFIVPDYIDRRLATPMLHIVYNAPFNARFEGVLTPWMTPDRLAADGMWKPAASNDLTNMVTEALTTNLGNKFSAYNTNSITTAAAAVAYQADPNNAAKKTAYETAAAALTTSATDYLTTLTKTSSFKADSLYPNTMQLKYGQAGLRSTFTIGSVDLGVSYYAGHYKQPTANLQNTIQNEVANIPTATLTSAAPLLMQYGMTQTELATLGAAIAGGSLKKSAFDALPSLDYDMLQVFGLEAATTLGPFNTRAEFAYNLTKDIAGDDPWVKNNSIAWEAGFDINLPIHNVNLNFQTTGKYVLKNDKIENGGIEIAGVTIPWKAMQAMGARTGNSKYKNYDTDYDKTGKYIRNQFIVDITDTFNHEKIKLDVKGIFQLETKDLILMPSLSFRLGGDDFTLTTSGLVLWCYDEDSEYWAWRNNDFVSVGIKYQF